MLTIEESRDEAMKLAAAGYDAVVIHAPQWRDDWDDDAHTYTYQPAMMAPEVGETVVERYQATGTPAYLTATPADVLRGWVEAYGARTKIERELITECYRRSQDTGDSVAVILMEAERYWATAGRSAEPRRWRSRLDACRRMLARVASA
jgi:hypothetical protein